MTAGERDILEFLSRLVSFDSTSHRPNRKLIAFLESHLARAGARVGVYEAPGGGKANLIASIGPEVPGGLMLAGHSDVVPVEGQAWRSDPFEASIRGGRVYGRGTADMKGFLAVAMALASELTSATLRVPVHLAVTYDEEIGCFGAQALAPLLAGLPAKPACCVVGEPTGMTVVDGHKGKLSLDCRVRGTEGHSAHNDRGVNAIEIAAELVVRLRSLQRRLARDGTKDERFDPPFTTVHAGLIAGGTARNVLPRDCRFEVEIRNLPGDDPKALLREVEDFARTELEPEMRAVSRDAGILIEIQSNIPALAPGTGGEFLRRALALSGDNRPAAVSFATEAGLYQRTGMDVIVYGPGDIRDAHKADESVAVDQLARCAAFLRGLIADIQARAS